jgi:hypothetical protein
VGDDRKGEVVTEMTPRQMLDAIDRAVKEARKYCGRKSEPAPPLVRIEYSQVPISQMTSRQILDEIGLAVAEASRRFSPRKSMRSATAQAE